MPFLTVGSRKREAVAYYTGMLHANVFLFLDGVLVLVGFIFLFVLFMKCNIPLIMHCLMSYVSCLNTFCLA